MRRRTGLRLIAFGLGIVPTAVLAQLPGDDLIGTWEGPLTPQLRIVFHVERGADGSLAGTVDSPDQASFGNPMSEVSLDGDAVTFGIAVFGASFEGALAGDEITGTFTQGGADLPLTLTRSEGATEAPRRPQEPTEPLPYDVEDVGFAGGAAGVVLSGTLTLPRGPGPLAGAVLVSGSGPQDRDEALMGHRPFLVLADHLTRAGVAVLRYDDRGVGDSQGDFESATSEDFAADALAAVSYLRARSEVDPESVGIVGHSEGGLVAPMAANRSEDVAFVVMLAGPGVPGIDILVAQGRLINEAAGTAEAITEFNARLQRTAADIVAEEPDDEAAVARMVTATRAEIDALPEPLQAPVRAQLDDAGIDTMARQMTSPWFRFFLHHDPRPDLEALSVPVLALVGGKDLQVPYALNNPEIEAAFARGGNADATVRMLPGLNHLFQEAETGSPAEYARIEQTMSPTMLDAVSTWITERFGPGR